MCQPFLLNSLTLFIYCPTIYNIERVPVAAYYTSCILYINQEGEAVGSILVKQFVENICLVNGSFVVTILETQSEVFLLEL